MLEATPVKKEPSPVGSLMYSLGLGGSPKLEKSHVGPAGMIDSRVGYGTSGMPAARSIRIAARILFSIWR